MEAIANYSSGVSRMPPPTSRSRPWRPLPHRAFLTFLLGGALTASAAAAQEHTPDASTLLLLHFNGTVSGAQGEVPTASAGVGFEPGIFGDGAFFPSGNQLHYASTGNVSATRGTLEFWFRPRWNGNDGAGHVVLRAGGSGGMWFGKDSGNFWRMILNRFAAGGLPELGVGFYVTDEWLANQWHHCAFTWSPTLLTVYVDGTLRARAIPAASPPAVSAAPLQIGADDAVSPADGVIEELRISDVVRSAMDILASYEAGRPAPTLPAPAKVGVTPFHTTTLIEWNPIDDPAVAGYRIERRYLWGQFDSYQRVLAPRSSCNDHGLGAGTSYEYRVAAIGADGARIGAFSAPVLVQTNWDSWGYSRHKSFETLVAFYRGGYGAADVSRLSAGLRTALEFYWRTTNGRLVLDPTWKYIDGAPAAGQWGPVIENDLRGRGVADAQYDLAYLVGNGLAGCLGGYLVLGGTCASLGTTCGAAYPGKDPAVDYTIAWTFTHEIHHALELMENLTPGTPEVLFCHFPWCYPDPLGPTGWHMDWGTHYDGIAAANRGYLDQWSTFPEPYDDYIECLDSDRDGLPDADARVPMDEARLGTNPESADTDGDGLDDLAEYCRYNFRGTDPLRPDTDGDSFPDGLDEEPLYPVAPGIRAVQIPLTIDGSVEPRWPVLTTGHYFTRNPTPLDLTTYAAWDADALYLAFGASRRLRFMVSLDGSGEDGRFESPVRHSLGATDTDNPDSKQNHIGDTWGDGNHIHFAHGVGGAEVVGRGAIAGAQVASSVSGGRYWTEARIPRTLPGGAAYTWYPPGPSTPVTSGLTLTAGRVIGLDVTMSNFEDSNAAEFSGTWTSLFETHAYVDLPLLPWPVDVAEPAGSAAIGLQLPNPYRVGSAIALAAGTAAAGRVEVCDVLGRRVATLHAGEVPREGLRLWWNGRDRDGAQVPAGVYWIRAVVGRQHFSRKFTYLR
jgi:concanavalin A-like lectin/glucanase superfamily protein